MQLIASNSIIFFVFLSKNILGRAVPQSQSAYAESHTLRDLATEYLTEINLQNQAIEDVQNQLTLGTEGSPEKISHLFDDLIESYYRQMEPRNRLVEITPTDSVLDSNSLEYLVAVASRYANNVMHVARQIRKDPIGQDSPLSALNYLKREHQKTQMFDQILLGLANVADDMEDSDEEFTSGKEGQLVVKDDEATTADNVTDPQVEISEGKNLEEISVTVEQEIQTTTTETIVKSYTETTVGW